jgi:hypothetical protein
MDDFPCKATLVQSRCSPSWRTRSLTTKKLFFVIIKWGSLTMAAGANPMNFWPIWSSLIQKCILRLVLRFLCIWTLEKNPPTVSARCYYWTCLWRLQKLREKMRKLAKKFEPIQFTWTELTYKHMIRVTRWFWAKNRT